MPGDDPSAPSVVAAEVAATRWWAAVGRRWPGPAPAALAVALAWWVLVGYRLGELRHERFATFGFDLGIYGQAAWLVAHGESPFMTVRGLDVWGHHGTFVFYLLAPGSWLGGDAGWLLFAQLVAQAAGGVALYLLVRDLSGRRGLGVAAAALLLLNPTQQWLVWEHFHPETFAVGPLLLAWWAQRTERWGWFAAAALVAASCKEDLALAIAMMGVAIALTRSGDARRIRIGVGTLLVAVGWYLLVTQVLIPARNPYGAFYVQQFFGDFGSSTSEVLRNVVAHPMTFLRYVTETRAEPAVGSLTPTGHLEWYRMMILPTLGIGFLRPRALLVAAPAVAVAMLTDTGHNWVRDYRFHYSAVVSACFVLAAVEVVIALARRVERRAGAARHAPALLVAVLVAAGVVASRLWGAYPSLLVTTSVAGGTLVLAARLGRAPETEARLAALALVGVVVAGVVGFHAGDAGVATAVVALALALGARVAGRLLDVRAARVATTGAVVLAVAASGLVVGDLLAGRGKADPGTGYWPFRADETALDAVLGVDPSLDPVAAAKRRAVDRVPADASVSAAYNIVPHLTERTAIYEFPNPWVPSNWGVQNELQADPATVEYLVYDSALVSSDPTDRTATAVRAIVDHLLAEEFEVVSREQVGAGEVVLARRIAPPSCIDDPSGVIRSVINDQRYETVAPPSTGKVCPVT